MRNLYATLLALVAIVNTAVAPVAPQIAKLTAQPAEAATQNTTSPNYLVKLNTASDQALEVVSTRANFDTEVMTSVRAAQAAKAQAEATAAAQAAEQAAAARAQVARAVSTSPAPTLTGSDAEYKLYIYQHESGNNPTRANGSGCLGLGQACPGSKLLAVCPTLDYACEDAFFTNYAVRRYGSWAGAYAFWIAHRWW